VLLCGAQYQPMLQGSCSRRFKAASRSLSQRGAQLMAVVRFWESGARVAEEERGSVQRGRDTKWGLLPEAVVCLPGRAYRFPRGWHKVDDDQLNTVS
jgi:hypothetical protein